ncbi:hypothetical protein BK120_19765 [Paenibacillus sp. FSL A5-0031]|nr:hypothetical protein BK120_19765 [Paenibacillus sp. FSL A5-0031]
MYFANKKHAENFNLMLEKYPVAKKDSQYQTGFYIVAHPVIFDHCDGNPVSDGHGPFDWYFEVQDDSPPSNRTGLSSGYLFLVKAGLNLYNNHQHELRNDDFSTYLALGTWGDELFKVFVEACQIRRGRLIYQY